MLNNKIGDEGFASMSTDCMAKIKRLAIGDCNDIYLTFKGTKAFTTSFKVQPSAVSLITICFLIFHGVQVSICTPPVSRHVEEGSGL